MSKVVRSVKNITKGYNTVQIKVRNATSNDPWGPAGSDMAEIAQMTFNSDGDDMLTDIRAETFYQIMDMIDKRLNDKGKNWRHVLKALKVLDYCLHEGSELVVTWARKNLYIIKTLREFQYIDEDGRDVGQNGRRCLRVSAKELTSLILDEDRLRTERADRKNWKSRVTGLDDFAEPSHAEPPRRPRPQRADEEDAEYRLAIEASKFQEEEDRKKRESRHGEPDDDDLAKAIKLSQEEEELRRRELEEQNAHSLFDDDPIQVAQPTGFNQGYQQQGAVDWSGNPIDPSLQTQPTGHASSKPTLSTLQEQKTLSQFNNPSFNPPTTFTPPAPQKELSEHEARLNALLASGDGMDTFGNTGNLRIPAQHTAPGTFVNSAGAGLGRIHEQQTGHNPFLQSQFTGMPQTTYNNTASAGAFGSSPFGRQVPAATGPAGMNGGGVNGFGQSSNPFGPRPPQGQNGQGGGDLIQF
ncbi:putative epsin-1 protein [Rutstroemia sp. NJR-2017a WRK4]|nr:putative epsin-1 protein [Rutstroemia sp. NJR-2017a WRK4]